MPTGTANRSRRFVDLSPLRASPAFARVWFGNLVSGIGAQMTIVAVGLQIYERTGSSLAVGLVGGIALLPTVVAGLWGGMVADAFDRRTVLILSSSAGWLSIAGLIALTLLDLVLGRPIDLWVLYALTTVNAMAATISSTTRSALAPRLLPPELVPAASALGGLAMGSIFTIGPALGGVLVATSGYAVAYGVDLALFSLALLGIWALPKLPPLVATARPGLASLREGFAFLRRAPNIRAGFLIDIVAMTFGRPHAMLPALGALAIGGGATTVGVLTASLAVGTLVASALSGPVGQARWHGRAIGLAVIAYGACIALFGGVVALALSGLLPRIDGGLAPWAIVLAGLALAGAGAADQVSAVFRQTMMLMAAPDHMRGRLQGVYIVVVSGGPRLGDLYAGGLATVLALWMPPVLGGALIIATAALVLRAQRGFREYDARDPRP